MSDATEASDVTTGDVGALLDERRRYETWLATLEERRAVTAPHVFERVVADYRARLDRVTEQLAAQEHAIRNERAGVESRLTLVAAEERMHRDERAELELRTLVGELASAEADASLRAVDEATAQLSGERESLERRIEELDALLATHAPDAEPPGVRDAVTPAAESPSDASASEDFIEMPRALEPSYDAPPPEAPTMERSPRTPGGSFDELAFLDTVVSERVVIEQATSDAESLGAAMAHQATPASLLGGLGGVSDSGSQRSQRSSGNDDVRPLAANVPANTPIVLRASGSIEQSKTLKCGECGGMNYPTEWYCERCGAELAAL
jgi:hypothetical protein